MIVSVHHYELVDTTTPDEFEAAVRTAERRGLVDLPGLVDWWFLRGSRGEHENGFAAVWIYQDRQSWANPWGPVGEPVTKNDSPEEWRVWEDDILAPLITGDPDRIDYTSFEVSRRRDR